MKNPKKRCWSCGFLDVIRWGKQQDKQRYKCKNCGILFTDNRPTQRVKNRFIGFRKWVQERQTYKTISRDSGYSIDTILEQAPKVKIIKREKVNLEWMRPTFRGAAWLPTKMILMVIHSSLDLQTVSITKK